MTVSVSVVIPTYRSAAWVEATLESVVQQTYPRDALELIVTDDVSPDESVAVARRFLSQHEDLVSRVVVREKNGGAPANRNSGWRLATGTWIQFLDADDLLMPHKIALQAELAARVPNDVAVVYSNWQHLLLEEGDWRPSGSIYAPFVDDDPILRILQQLDFGYVGPTLIRKSFLERVSGFDEKPNLGEDCDLLLRIAMAGGQFREARSEQAAFLYRQSPGSLWKAYIKNKEAMRNLLFGFREVERFLRAKRGTGGLSEPERIALAKRYSRFADLYCEHDPESFVTLMSWLEELGFHLPTELNPRFQRFARLLGFRRAVRIRSALRRARERLRSA